MRRLFPPLGGLDDYDGALRRITKSANTLLFAIVRDCAGAHSGGPPTLWDEATIRARTGPLMTEFIAARTRFIGANQEVMVRALEEARLVPA